MNHELFDFNFFGQNIVVTGWKLMGSIGALMFAGRWVVQFFYARRAGRPVTPLLFWVLSVFGSSLQLIYFIFSPKQDMVGILSNFLPSFVAVYNLYLELRHRARLKLEAANGPDQQSKKKEDNSTPPPLMASAVPVESAAGE